MTTRTSTPATSPARSCCPRASRARASTSPTRPRRRSRSAWSRYAPLDGDNRMQMSTALSQTLLARDPATGARLGEVRATAPEEIEGVVGEVARVQPLWALLRVEDRARYMRRVAQAIIDELDELAELLGREQGRPRGEVLTLELLPAIDALIWIAEEGGSILGRQKVKVHRSLSLTKRARIVHEPYGVVGVIGAGSAPFAQPLGQIAGALLAGNGVTFKPAPRACLAGERIARVLARADLPEGLVRLVHGGAPVGVALARAPATRCCSPARPRWEGWWRARASPRTRR